MALVSISEAAKLTGKSRRTIQRHIATGKLSKSNVATGCAVVDTSELMRVFGALSVTPLPHDTHVTMSHHVTQLSHHDSDYELLKKENDFLKQRLIDKDDHISSLKKAMLLLESKIDSSTPPVVPKKRWKFWKP